MLFTPDPVLLDSPRGRPQILDLGEIEAAEVAPRILGEEYASVALIGGGLASVSVLTYLWHEKPSLYKKAIVIDREGRFASRFFRRARMIGQRTLRSPYEHHLGTHNHGECELLDIARFNWENLTDFERGQVRMAQAGRRSVVPLDIFESHIMHVINLHDMNSLIRQGEVLSISRRANLYRIEGEGFNLFASHVIICTGERRNDQHSYFGRKVIKWDECLDVNDGSSIAVSGSGLTAAYLVSMFLERFNRVHWISRDGLRYGCSDVDSKFFRPEGREEFRSANLATKREMLHKFRKPSIMFEFRPYLEEAISSGRILLHRDDHNIDPSVDIVLAHGTKPESPTILFSVKKKELPDGGIFVDDKFRIPENRPGSCFAIGSHGAYAVGPAARNIDGIRYAAEVVCREIREDVIK